MNNKKTPAIFLALMALYTVLPLEINAIDPMPPHATNPMQQMPGAPITGQQLSLEDLQAMEQLVENERLKMTDEQRAQFDRDVLQLTKEFEKWQQENPEEFAQFTNQLLSGELPMEQIPEQPTTPVQQPEETPAPVQQAEEPVKTQEDKEKQEAAIKRINSIIARTQSFLLKTGVMAEFPGKIKKWAEQGKIRGWIPSYTWESVKDSVGVKEQIEKLIQSLNAIKEQDRATKTYKYLDAVIAHEDLYKNLGTLEKKLKELEPQVEIDEHGIEPVSKEVRAIMRSILGEYVNALFVLNIPQDIDSVIKSFEATAKKYREEEDEITKKALTESKKIRPAQGTVVAGSPEADFYAPSSGSMNAYDYFPYSNQSYAAPSYPTPSSDFSNQRTPEPQRDDATKKKEENSKPGKESEKKPQEEPKDTADDKKIRKGIDQLEGNLSEATQAIENINARPESATNLSAGDVATGVRKAKQATGNLNALKIKIRHASTDKKRDRFKEEVRELHDINKDILNSVKNMQGDVAESKKAASSEDDETQTYKKQDLIKAVEELNSAFKSF